MNILKKVQEGRLKCYGHVMRREDHYIGKRAKCGVTGEKDRKI